MSIKTLSRQVKRLKQKIEPPLLIINTTRAKEELLAWLEAQIALEQKEGKEERTYTEEEERYFREVEEALDVIMEERLEEEARYFRVKYI